MISPWPRTSMPVVEVLKQSALTPTPRRSTHLTPVIYHIVTPIFAWKHNYCTAASIHAALTSAILPSVVDKVPSAESSKRHHVTHHAASP
jgi:hypothetical protein